MYPKLCPVLFCPPRYVLAMPPPALRPPEPEAPPSPPSPPSPPHALSMTSPLPRLGTARAHDEVLRAHAHAHEALHHNGKVPT